MFQHHLYRTSRSLVGTALCVAVSGKPLTSNCEKGQPKKKVLIVGCGLTGALAARQLSSIPRYHIDVVERATYPAGRFGARAMYRGARADVGAQVLSTVNPNDFRARGGHGVFHDNLKTAQDIVKDLVQQNLLERINDTALGETDERMIWEELWQHYVAPRGLSTVLEALIPFSVKTEYGVKVQSVQRLENGKVKVSGVCRSPDLPSNGTTFQRVYDAAIVCVAAPDALQIQGVQQLLDADSQKVLKAVGYDSRTCEAHFFDPNILRPALTQSFPKGKLEVDVEDDQQRHNLSYISWQDRKQTIHGYDFDTPCAIVVHGRAEPNPQPLDEAQIDQVLASVTGLSPTTISRSRLYKKSISWEISQMIRPMEAVVNDPPMNGAWQCLVAPSANLIVAGDFMTQSSFVGCVATADAAAKTISEIV